MTATSHLYDLLNRANGRARRSRAPAALAAHRRSGRARRPGRKLPRLVDSSKLEFPPRASARGNVLAAGFPARRAV